MHANNKRETEKKLYEDKERGGKEGWKERNPIL